MGRKKGSYRGRKGYIGITGAICGYRGIMEKNMETKPVAEVSVWFRSPFSLVP